MIPVFREVGCSICGSKINFGLSFAELDGNPFVCSKCVYAKLTGKEIDYNEELKERIENSKE